MPWMNWMMLILNGAWLLSYLQKKQRAKAAEAAEAEADADAPHPRRTGEV